MAKKIIPSAYFKVWGRKKKLGKIIFSDGSCSNEVWTKTMAFQELIKYRNKLIWKVEAEVVANQINNSPLPMHASEDKVITIYAPAIQIIETLNQIPNHKTKKKNRRLSKDILKEEDDQRYFSE